MLLLLLLLLLVHRAARARFRACAFRASLASVREAKPASGALLASRRSAGLLDGSRCRVQSCAGREGARCWVVCARARERTEVATTATGLRAAQTTQTRCRAYLADSYRLILCLNGLGWACNPGIREIESRENRAACAISGGVPRLGRVLVSGLYGRWRTRLECACQKLRLAATTAGADVPMRQNIAVLGPGCVVAVSALRTFAALLRCPLAYTQRTHDREVHTEHLSHQ